MHASKLSQETRRHTRILVGQLICCIIYAIGSSLFDYFIFLICFVHLALSVSLLLVLKISAKLQIFCRKCEYDFVRHKRKYKTRIVVTADLIHNWREKILNRVFVCMFHRTTWIGAIAFLECTTTKVSSEGRTSYVMSLFRGMLHIAISISFCKLILFPLLTTCLCGQDKMASRAGFGPWAVVWRPLLYIMIITLSIYCFITGQFQTSGQIHICYCIKNVFFYLGKPSRTTLQSWYWRFSNLLSKAFSYEVGIISSCFACAATFATNYAKLTSSG